MCGQGVGAEIRKNEYRKLQQFSFANTDRFRTSSLVTRLTGDVTNIQNSISTGMRPACRAPVMMITAIAVSFYINKELAVIFLIAAPVLGIFLFLIISHVRPLYARMQKAVDLVNRIIQENLTAIRVVKSYVRGDYELSKFEEVNAGLQTTSGKGVSCCIPEYACHAVCHVYHDPLYPLVRRESDSGGRYEGRRTDRIFELCPSGAQFPDDDIQCIYDVYPFPYLMETYY